MLNKKNESTKKSKIRTWDVIIIGSGPAALTASIYTTRGAASTLILAGEKWGGQLMLTTNVDNFPGFPDGILGPDLIFSMRKQAEKFGATFLEKNVETVDFSQNLKKIAIKNDEFLARSIIIATGADTLWLGVPGEEKLIGKGVSSCAPCDAPFFKNKKVCVIGGGDSAMEEALVLNKYADKVTLIHRRNEFKASIAMQKKVFEKEKEGKIGILWNTEVLSMKGENTLQSVSLSTKVESKLDLELTKKTILNNKGIIKEEKKNNLKWDMPIEGLFVAIGHSPSTKVFQGKIELNERGYVKRFENELYSSATSKDGVFVAGDVHDYHYRQAITAAAFGCIAALDVLRYLDKSTPSW